ncbi:hypothetical protein CONPUDRAFT_154918 [Coniophora puteana RWD-64-598 SS2]|uniref:F-box domain-containing protein n=1 Tax=Coniophora puteana (strain RWD-64-598) TaxID=741705 RepID=A0A5M3MKM4_CONPW|nr:uncharacterized protein CONPUDRAFT_154918 [Coniophora puteana RWD-64-598 SS2]EIW79520.1 hypothetical protein CONPUDRAFT_154918 [Coniophora puteana RWD-64-598 SS2]
MPKLDWGLGPRTITFDETDVSAAEHVDLELADALSAPASAKTPPFPKLCKLDWEYPGPFSLLRSVARTCQDFKEPALDALYYKIDCLSDVFLTLPKEMLMFHEHSFYGFKTQHVSLVPPVAESTWQFLLGYLRRVRVLDLALDPEQLQLDLDVWCYLLEAELCDYLFPNLQTLILKHRVVHSELLPMLCSPHLTSIELHNFFPVSLDDADKDDESTTLTRDVLKIMGLRKVSRFSADVASMGIRSPEIIVEFVDTLASSFDKSLAKAISITQSVEPNHLPRVTLTLDLLEPLFVYSGLTVLTFTVTAYFELDDFDLASISTALPRLQKLCLGGKVGWRDTYYTSFSGIASILRNCPDLRYLEVIVDATVSRNASFAAQTVPEGGYNTHVREIRLADSPIDDEAFAARQLRRMMPRLRSVIEPSIHTDGTSHCGAWTFKWLHAQKFLD